jgi:hypothetical protein
MDEMGHNMSQHEHMRFDRSTGSGDQEDLPSRTAILPIIDVTELVPTLKAKGRAKAKAATKKKSESSSRVGYLIEEDYAAGAAASSSTSSAAPATSALPTGMGYGRGGVSSLTPAQSASSRGRKITQIAIKPEAADASTQTSQADLEAPSAPSSSIPSAAADVPREEVKGRRRRRKKKQIIGKASSK